LTYIAAEKRKQELLRKKQLKIADKNAKIYLKQKLIEQKRLQEERKKEYLNEKWKEMFKKEKR